MVWTADALKILQACINNGESYKSLGSRFGVSSCAIEKAVSRHNLTGFKSIQTKMSLPEISERIDLGGCNDVDFEELKENAKLRWKIEKTKIAANKKKPFKTMLVVGDHHVPEHDVAAHRAIFNLMDDVKFDGLVELGDFMDLACISHWNKGKNKTLEGKRLKADYVEGNAVLDEFDKRLPKGAERHFFKGNHEKWVDQLIDDQPVLEGLFDIESALHLEERGYKVYDYNEIVSFGRLKITHGIYAGANPAKTHVMKTLSNILVGHVHSPEMVLVHSPAKEVSVVGYCNGCLCGMAPEYMKNRPHNWAAGFAILYLFPDGAFDVNLIRLVKNRFVFNGKVYSGV